MTLEEKLKTVKVVALAGGVGGAKLVEGLAQVLPGENLTVIVNTGDDFEHFGLYICPDQDTVCYMLAGISNPATGWGRAGETWKAYEAIGLLGGPTWFRLGDLDLATHLERTRRLHLGEPLSTITKDFCKHWGIVTRVLPMTDDPAPTLVHTDEGTLGFQEYFVMRQCHPHVTGFDLNAAKAAKPAPGVVEALGACDLVLFCPSNPWVSIDPILAVKEIRKLVSQKPVVAVTPIISGQAVKGPAAKMFQELGVLPSATAVAAHYRDLLQGFVLDEQDHPLTAEIRALGIRPLVTNTLMVTSQDRKRLALETLSFCLS